MGKKHYNLITEGEYTTKVYFLAYIKPITYTEMVETLHDLDPNPKRRFPNSKIPMGISRAIKKLSPDYLEYKDKKYSSKVEPLIKEIEKTLEHKSLEISDQEKEILLILLDSNEFRSFIDPDLETNPNEAIDGANTIIRDLLMVVSSVKTLRKTFSEDERAALRKISHEDYLTFLGVSMGVNELSKLIGKSLEIGDLEKPFLDAIGLFSPMPEDLLMKISKLDRMGDLFDSFSKVLSRSEEVRERIKRLIIQ